MGDVLDDRMEFEPDYEEEENGDNKGDNNKGGGGMGFPFPALAKTTGEWW